MFPLTPKTAENVLVFVQFISKVYKSRIELNFDYNFNIKIQNSLQSLTTILHSGVKSKNLK